MKIQVLKGNRKRYKGILVVFFIVILTSVLSIFVRQRSKIAYLSDKNFEIQNRKSEFKVY